MKKFLLALVLMAPILAWGNDDISVCDEDLRIGSVLRIIDTPNTEQQMKDAVLLWIADKHSDSIDKKTDTSHGFLIPVQIYLSNGSEIEDILICNIKMDFKDYKARIQLTDMQVLNRYKHYETFSKTMPISEYCFIDSVKFDLEKSKTIESIQNISTLLNTKLSKKNKKEAEHQLDIANNHLALIESSFDYDVRFGKPKNKASTINAITTLLKDFESTIKKKDDW